MTDLLALGETMLRLSAPGDERLETAATLDVRVGGAESNVAVAAARLGLEAAWVSKLPDSPLGRRVADEIRRHGVDPVVAWADDARQGVYFLEGGPAPRDTAVVYDRSEAAVTTLTPEEVPTDRVGEADAVFISGITPALSSTLAETTAEVFRTASGADAVTVLDVNYRSKLWTPEAAKAGLEALFPHVDVLVLARRDAETVFESTGPATAVGAALADDHGFELVVVTRGSEGAVAVEPDATHEQPAFDAADDYPVGSGDAFIGGFLARYLRAAAVPDALAYGAATAALKRGVPGDLAVVSPAEVARVRDEAGRGIAR